MTETTEKQLSVDDILDQTLDDLADLPEWKPYPAGIHKVTMTFESGKSASGDPQIKAKLVAIETIELANDKADTLLEKGAETQVLYTLNNEFGQGAFKKLLAIFKEHLGMPDGVKNGAIMKAAQGMECIVITTIQENKQKTQKFTKIQEVAFE